MDIGSKIIIKVLKNSLSNQKIKQTAENKLSNTIYSKQFNTNTIGNGLFMLVYYPLVFTDTIKTNKKFH